MVFSLQSSQEDENRDIADIRSMTIEELTDIILSLGEKKFRAAQIYDWLHKKGVQSWDDMKNVPSSLKMSLMRQCKIASVTPVQVLVSAVDGTRKYLMELHDHNIIECVLLRYDYGNSICISSQVGCRMGCSFCASTIDGLVRNLTPGEMLGQIYAVAHDIGERIGHIVIMGSGEPLDNYDAFLRFIEMVTDEKGICIGARNITASTCGIVPKIMSLADEKLQITLALSLHAVSDEKRRSLMPVARSYSLDEVLNACTYYFEKTGRRITCEYSLIAGKNDTDEDAAGLVRIAERIGCHINLIPVNPIEERDYRQTAPARVLAFKNKLEKYHINVTIRREMGRDIQGACGQLRRSYLVNSPKT